MKIVYHRTFFKDAEKVPEAAAAVLKALIDGITSANMLADIVGCKPLSGVKNGYRIRRGDYRILLLYRDNIVYLRRVVVRGQAYKKHNI
ncbi:MAG: type II toxin-antitoxin system RelE/ParE family toxin [Prevotellaceae bacterium]|jgi:mRNA interferase RelE/StbE|nr:type II toxin-antitoxin system RelE/ParE family toxin [Prevotellaceae bacterium]